MKKGGEYGIRINCEGSERKLKNKMNRWGNVRRWWMNEVKRVKKKFLKIKNERNYKEQKKTKH